MNRAELQTALKLTAAALARDDKAPALSSYFFHDDRVHAYDDEICLSTPCEFPVDGGVNGKHLVAWVSTCSGDEIKVTGTKEMQLTCGRSKLKLSMLNTKLFVFDPPDEYEGNVIVAPAELAEAIMKVARCMGTDVQYPWRMGVTVRSDGVGVADVYASNNIAVAQAWAHVVDDGKAVEVVLTPRFVEVFLKLYKDEGVDAIAVGNGWAKATFADGTELVGRTITDVRADTFEGIFSTVCGDGSLEVMVVPEGLAEVVKQTDKMLSVTKATTYADLVVKGKTMTVTAQTGIAALLDSVPCDTDMSISVKVQPKELLLLLDFANEMSVTHQAVILLGDDYVGLLSLATGSGEET
jgi:hypothetical protein